MDTTSLYVTSLVFRTSGLCNSLALDCSTIHSISESSNNLLITSLDAIGSRLRSSSGYCTEKNVSFALFSNFMTTLQGNYNWLSQLEKL